MVARFSYLIAMAVGTACSGCVSTGDLMSVRQDVQKEMQEMRSKYDRSLSDNEAKRKTMEELQLRLSKDIDAQGKTLASLATTTRDLQSRHEMLLKERASGQNSHALVRDAMLRALKTEQTDLEQRLKKTAEYIRELEQTDASGQPGKTISNTSLAPERSDHTSGEEKPATDSKPAK
ncbi:hypothetical protein W02_42500 [Nitrospira sp. KM1]|uniref:hypothetical protein n=1 Tax=Nitrospira sp. KM1 TaxID=1936990 RepID=UPI0013A75F46|nr:hypothetical protein [Nitrospira sp. KM1]BCA57110.1 hypothetical protein W02_42500 [Nitrospira sp. KM1]